MVLPWQATSLEKSRALRDCPVGVGWYLYIAPSYMMLRHAGLGLDLYKS